MHLHPSVRKWALRIHSGFNWLFWGGVVFIASGFLWQRWEIRSLKQEVRSLGLPTTREELDRFYVVPEGIPDNSADWNPALSAISGTMKETASKELQPFICDPTSIPLPGESWDLEGQAVAFLDAHHSDLAALHHAASVGGQTRLPLDYKLDYEKFESFDNHIRGALTLLQFEAGFAAYQGDPAKCRNAQETAVGLYLAVQGQPDLIGFLSANSQLFRLSATLERLLSLSQWTDSELASVQHQLNSIDYRQQLKLAIVGECVSQIDHYEQIFPLSNGSEFKMLRWSLFARQSLDDDWPVVLTQFQKMEEQVAAESKTRFRISTVYFEIFAPYRSQHAVCGAIAEARRSLVNAGLAVHRFLRRHGRLPTTLAEVETDLFGAGKDETISSIDPFDGKPLRYLVQTERCLIYSIGWDQLDNGGDVDFDDSGDSRKGPMDIGFSVRR